VKCYIFHACGKKADGKNRKKIRLSKGLIILEEALYSKTTVHEDVLDLSKRKLHKRRVSCTFRELTGV
jgi:hypothetical protein